MLRLEDFVKQELADGVGYFTSEEAKASIGLGVAAFASSAQRLVKKGKVAHPRQGFYMILRSEDRSAGTPDPTQWIAPLMQDQGLDCRISLLRTAARHGASHQAVMVIQVVSR